MKVSFKAALGLIASFTIAVAYNACSNVSFLGSGTSILNQETVGGNPLTRPGYNLGVGFYVLGGKLYDANNVEFRMRGVDRVHWDGSSSGLGNSKANTVRWLMDFTQAPGKNIALLQGGKGKTGGTIYNQMIVMPYADTSPAGGLTCSTDPATLQSAVDVWVAQASSWTQLERYSIINIANEWGPSNSTVWRDSYITAIARLRAAGYHAAISVTSGGCGQDIADLTTYAQAVFDSDPEKNVIFDLHIYGASLYDSAGGVPQSGTQQDLGPTLLALGNVGLVINIGEFGPGRNIGPSPTLISPTRVIQAAEAAQIGWLAWAWDDNDLAGEKSDNKWLSMSYTEAYNTSSDLTIYGQQIVEGCTNPAPGGCGCPDSPAPAMTAVEPMCVGTPQPLYSPYSLKALAVPASIFN